MNYFYFINKKAFLFLIFSVFSLQFSFAQIPSNYYDTANNLTGLQLKNALNEIITDGHVARGYNQLYDGDGISNSQGYIDTHTDNVIENGYENDNTILDFYSENPNGEDSYNYTHGNNQCGNQSSEGDCYNREHLIPQSSFNSALPMQSDIHHVIPTDGRVNNFRGSLPFGNVSSANFTSMNGSKRGSSAVSGFNGTVFEPIDEFKGDIARSLLYFAVRYQDTVDDYNSFPMFNGTEDEVFFPWAIDLLLDWHLNIDPVDQRERDRNQAAYRFQGNANPFVDHPEYASLIWSSSTDNEAPSIPTNIVASNPTASTINLSWNASTDNVSVTRYDIFVDGANSFSTANLTITINNLNANTEYCFRIVAKDGSGNTSQMSDEVCESTISGTQTQDELFISEYVEGSVNNKAIEIANPTNSTINLSTYSIARDTNSNGSWGTQLNLTGNIGSREVFVISHSNAAIQSILDVADQVSSADAMLFNGNDPVGLFKDGTLIDVFGDFGGSNNFDNVTYRRKGFVTKPTTTFDLNTEWDMYSQNNVEDLGMHFETLTTNEFSFSLSKVHPNPANHLVNISWARNQIALVELFSQDGKRLLKKEFENKTQIDINQLNSGVYILRISSGEEVETRKLIKN